MDDRIAAISARISSGDSLGYAYITLGDIAQAQPELAGQVVDAIKEGLKSEKNDRDSLDRAYSALGDIAQAQPELAGQVVDAIKEGLKSEKNGGYSLRRAYSALGEIVKAQPELAGQVVDAIKEGLKSEKNGEYSLESAYIALGNITQAQPELVDEIADYTAAAGTWNSLERFTLMASCMQKWPQEKLKDFISAHPEQEVWLKAAYNMRRAVRQEIGYVYNTFDTKKISEMNFSKQQRCLNVLVLQLNKELSQEPAAAVDIRKNLENSNIFNDNADWLVPGSFKAAEIFGSYFPSYIKNVEQYLSTHDAVYWLPSGLTDDKKQSFSAFVNKHMIYADINGKKQCRPLAELEIIGRNWQKLPEDKEKSGYKEVLSYCQSRKYVDQEYDAFAVEAARWGVSEETYKYKEDIYKAGLKVPEPFDSSKEFKVGKYRGRFLPRDDVRIGFFGGYTDCCQHYDGVGKACAVSTVKDPYSQLFVIENDKGDIVAGSWVWENKEGRYREVCFDNIEAKGDFSKHRMLNEIYEQAGHYLTEEANCRRVTIGLGYQDADTHPYPPTKNIALPKQYGNEYSDAKGTQVLLAENRNAVPLDKNKESTRFIRDVCFLDIDDMDLISEQCFPEGDQRLQVPDRLSGQAIVDEEKGIVGYCLYDKEEKELYDMAVLPEYRTDQNASSRKLLAEVIREVRKTGGEWHAELRDKTTYRYMEIMSERGLVSLKNEGVDHVMSDGSLVYRVSFSVNQQPKEKEKLGEKSPAKLQKKQNIIKRFFHERN